jgi:hypothetical protein
MNPAEWEMLKTIMQAPIPVAALLGIFYIWRQKRNGNHAVSNREVRDSNERLRDAILEQTDTLRQCQAHNREAHKAQTEALVKANESLAVMLALAKKSK